MHVRSRLESADPWEDCDALECDGLLGQLGVCAKVPASTTAGSAWTGSPLDTRVRLDLRSLLVVRKSGHASGGLDGKN